MNVCIFPKHTVVCLGNSVCVHVYEVHYAKAPAALPGAAMLFEIQEKHTGSRQRHILF